MYIHIKGYISLLLFAVILHPTDRYNSRYSFAARLVLCTISIIEKKWQLFRQFLIYLIVHKIIFKNAFSFDMSWSKLWFKKEQNFSNQYKTLWVHTIIMKLGTKLFKTEQNFISLHNYNEIRNKTFQIRQNPTPLHKVLLSAIIFFYIFMLNIN